MAAVTEFLKQIVPPLTGEELFDHLSDVVYFVKDAKGAYLIVNNTLVVRCRVADKSALLGRTPAEVLGSPLGEQFADQDQRVLETGIPLLSQLELHVHPSGAVGWCLTTKLPLRNSRRQIVGLMGVSQDLRLPNFETDEYRQVVAATRYAEEHMAAPPSIGELAKIARMSVYQLDRRMRHVYGLSTGQWLLKARIDTSQRLLRETDVPISAIALETGYSDQSAFSRQFRRATGLTPRAYRTAFRTSES
jgi:AraC-like DNA-binding protein